MPDSVSNEVDTRRDQLAFAAFLVMVVLAGGNVVAVRYLTRADALDPFWAAATRFLCATAIFAVVTGVSKAPLPRGRALTGAVLYGALGIGGFFGFAYYGLAEVPAPIGGVLLACVPLLTFLLALAQRQEHFRWDGLAGGVLAVVGSAVVVSAGLDRGVALLPLLAILGAAACGAQAAIVVKAFPPVHPAAMNAVGMAAGTVILFALTFVAGESHAMPVARGTWAAQVYLVLAGSVGVFALYLYVLGRWTASALSYEFVLIPLVGVLLSAWLLDEHVTRVFVAGSLLILIGVYLGALRRRNPEVAQDPATC